MRRFSSRRVSRSLMRCSSTADFPMILIISKHQDPFRTLSYKQLPPSLRYSPSDCFLNQRSKPLSHWVKIGGVVYWSFSPEVIKVLNIWRARVQYSHPTTQRDRSVGEVVIFMLNGLRRDGKDTSWWIGYASIITISTTDHPLKPTIYSLFSCYNGFWQESALFLLSWSWIFSSRFCFDLYHNDRFYEATTNGIGYI